MHTRQARRVVSGCMPSKPASRQRPSPPLGCLLACSLSVALEQMGVMAVMRVSMSTTWHHQGRGKRGARGGGRAKMADGKEWVERREGVFVGAHAAWCLQLTEVLEED